MMDRQKIFDTVSKHLLTSKKRSLLPSSSGCAYRGQDGAKCAIGVLIKDEFYDGKLEGVRVGRDRAVMDSLIKSNVLSRSDAGLYSNVKFLGDLQAIHDEDEPEQWRQALRKFAFSNGLRLGRHLWGER